MQREKTPESLKDRTFKASRIFLKDGRFLSCSTFNASRSGLRLMQNWVNTICIFYYCSELQLKRELLSHSASLPVSSRPPYLLHLEKLAKLLETQAGRKPPEASRRASLKDKPQRAFIKVFSLPRRAAFVSEAANKTKAISRLSYRRLCVFFFPLTGHLLDPAEGSEVTRGGRLLKQLRRERKKGEKERKKEEKQSEACGHRKLDTCLHRYAEKLNW